MKKNELILSLQLVWPLLFGIALIMAGNGLQGTLLGLRGAEEGFSAGTIGLVMSLYYAGFLAGGYIIPSILESVGHIRVFAGLASLASTTILLHGVFVDPWAWSVVRVLSGISFSGLFIVSESWLNNIAPNKLRAQILGSYVAIVYFGLFAGQYLLYLAPVTQIELFILISVLISLALIPITLANKPSPGYEAPETMPYMELLRLSPLSISSVVVSGFCAAAVLGMGAVYFKDIGMGKTDVVLLISAYILGSALIPILIGWISDRFDRRKVIAVSAAGAFLLSIIMTVFGPGLITVTLLGGMITSCYSIAIAYLNDQIPPQKLVSATASLIMTNGMGSIAGPVIIGYGLKAFGTASFFLALALAMLFVICFGIFRALTGQKIDVEDQSEFYPMPARSSAEIISLAEDE